MARVPTADITSGPAPPENEEGVPLLPLAQVIDALVPSVCMVTGAPFVDVNTAAAVEVILPVLAINETALVEAVEIGPERLIEVPEEILAVTDKLPAPELREIELAVPIETVPLVFVMVQL